MSLIVQKYGGTSVGDAEKIKNVARRVIKAKAQGNKIVVIVSAMGDTTDDLLSLAHQITSSPDEREMDVLLSTGEAVSMTLLAMALRSMGQEAISLSGGQAGIHTDSVYSKAQILRVDTKRILKELEQGKIVVVAGFQGINEEMEVTTFGRGGSNITALALAAALDASYCAIYTDVDGIYTADPRLEPRARKLRDIGYDEMLEMAVEGAQVMHPRAVELGAVYGIPILVASSFVEAEGTWIREVVEMEARNKVRGVAHDINVAKVTILGVPDRPGIAAAVFEPLARVAVSVDTIVQNASVEKITDLTFTVARTDLARAKRVVEPVIQEIGAKGMVTDDQLAKVSIVGTGMQNAPGYAARMFRTLFEAGINIELITTSEIRITCIVHESRVSDAVRALHKAFELEKIEP